jgi:ribosomal protein S18 acetylase RimI-like enzyme
VTTAGQRALRPAGPGDAELLYRIYASTREDELAIVPWDAAQKEAFLRMQFAAQDRYYHATFPDASYDLIISGEQVLGRLYVDRGETAWNVIDLALVPEHRRQGIGTKLLTQVLADAGAAGRPVHMHVERFNPARRLYDRLGFHQIADNGVYLLLERKPRLPCRLAFFNKRKDPRRFTICSRRRRTSQSCGASGLGEGSGKSGSHPGRVSHRKVHLLSGGPSRTPPRSTSPSGPAQAPKACPAPQGR